jgi:predicted Zn-dependent protease
MKPRWLLGSWRGRLLLLAFLMLAAVAGRWALIDWYGRCALSAAEDAIRRHDHAEAGKHLRAAFRHRPDSMRAHLLAARLARQADELHTAEEHLEQCRQATGTLADEAALEWLLLRTQSGALDADSPRIRAYLETEGPTTPLVLECQVHVYRRTFRPELARVCLDRWIALEPDNPRPYVARARLTLLSQAPEYALDDLRKAAKLDPASVEPRLILGDVLLSVSQLDESAGNYRAVLEREPEHWLARRGLARSLREKGQPGEARKILEQMNQEKPDDPVLLFELGQAVAGEGKTAEAIRLFESSIERDPYEPQTHFHLARLLRREGRTADADAHEAQFKALDADRARFQQLTANLLREHPDDPALHHEAGELLLRLGQRKIAANAFRTALEKNPRYEPSRKALSLLVDEP